MELSRSGGLGGAESRGDHEDHQQTGEKKQLPIHRISFLKARGDLPEIREYS
jgi:hypothetical protein